MFSTIRTRVALAIATAAIVGTSLAPIATFAAPAAPTADVDGVVLKPDIKVELWAKYAGNHGKTWIVFDTSNVGATYSGPVAIKGECVAFDGTSSVAYTRIISNLNKNEVAQDAFTCSDFWGARVTVGAQGDTNLSNNVLNV